MFAAPTMNTPSSLQEAYAQSSEVKTEYQPSYPVLSHNDDDVVINKVEKPKRKPHKTRATHRTVRTIIKEIDGTYKAKALTTEFPIKRKQRARKAAVERNISPRNIMAWSKQTSDNNLITYSNVSLWKNSLMDSVDTKKGKANTEGVSQSDDQLGMPILKNPNLEDRKRKAEDLAQTHFDRITTIAHTNAASILYTPTKYRGTYSPKNPSLIVLLDMTTEANLKDVLSLNLHDVETVDGDTYATLFIPLAKAGSSLSVPIIITKFSSYLDRPQTAWKSVKGTKKSTIRLYNDREGIHTAALQDLDAKIERSDQGYNSKMVVVHDADIDLSAIKDVVHTTREGLVDLIASRLRDMKLHYVQ